MKIFPVGLDDLAEVFEVKGKLSSYKSQFNKLDHNEILMNEFKIYALQESITLFNALIEANKFIFLNIKLKYPQFLSTSTLSLKIFRTKYLDIPILKDDNFIRKSYFGGIFIKVI